jgi:hypothetical protein
VPFYAEPYISLRGVPAARYQDKNALVAEAELRWKRHAALGGGGIRWGGKAYGRRQSWKEAKTVAEGRRGVSLSRRRKLGMFAWARRGARPRR